MIISRIETVLIGLIALAATGICLAFGQPALNEQKASAGNAPMDPAFSEDKFSPFRFDPVAANRRSRRAGKVSAMSSVRWQFFA
jgi:hypothetical protein